MGELGGALHERGHLIAVAPVGRVIGEHEIGRLDAHQGDGLVAVARRQHPDVLAGKRELDDAVHHRVRIDEQQGARFLCQRGPHLP